MLQSRQNTAPQTYVTPPIVEERRFDHRTVQQALERAAQLQADDVERAHRLQEARSSTLALTEVEAIGAELDIEPRFIHQALDEQMLEDMRASIRHRRRRVGRLLSPRGIARVRDIGLMLVAPAILGPAIYMLLMRPMDAYWFLPLARSTFPQGLGLLQLFSFTLGALLGGRNRGVVAGLSVNGFAILTALVSTVIHSNPSFHRLGMDSGSAVSAFVFGTFL